ncbi:MAG: carbohydrate binding domain-containing protein [Phycisphaerales bacterium]|nr:MAG: carbohydrate binding domain-containing protein [Phycisphaerales bacterium]
MCRKLVCSVVLMVLALVAVMPVAQAQQVENLVLNHSFEEDEVIQDDGAYEGWWTWNPAEGAGSVATVDEADSIDGARSIRVDPLGSANWHFIVAYSTMTMDMSKDYTVSFWAKAEEPRPLTVAMKAADNSVGAWNATPFDLTTEWAEYTYTSDVLHTGVKLEIWCAATDVPLWLDFVYVYEGDYVAGIEPSGKVVPVQAADPDPATEAGDVPRDLTLSWTPGTFAAAHDVYFGTAFADVNGADRSNPSDVLVSEGQTAAAYDTGRLEFGQTYYWRVDEVNAAPDSTIYKGDVWSFAVEPFAYPVENIIASSNASSDAGAGPDNTVNGSGLNANDEHSTAATDMWLGTATDEPIWIQYEFDRVYKLHEMLVWNYNVQFELILGFGLKDVTVAYSSDGADWTTLGDVVLAQATARADYAANTTMDLGGVAARYVRLTVNSGYGTTGQLGLSEVRFLYIPAQARQPQPADGQGDVPPDTVLSWRAGREATSHEVYLSTDSQAVAGETALVDTVVDAAYAPQDLAFGTDYYWKINEVNESETVSVWEGDLWSFATQEYGVIDDFESYDDEENLIYEAWIDGWVNETGSTVGYLEAPFAERSIVNSGRQSMPLEYDNSAAPFYSEAERDLGGADWNARGADTLRLYVTGQADNDPAALYVAVEDTAGQAAVVTHEDPQIVLSTTWQEWLIPFGEFDGVNLSSVRTMYIGLGDRDNPSAGGAGLIFIDDIGVGHPASGQ